MEADGRDAGRAEKKLGAPDEPGGHHAAIGHDQRALELERPCEVAHERQRAVAEDNAGPCVEVERLHLTHPDVASGILYPRAMLTYLGHFAYFLLLCAFVMRDALKLRILLLLSQLFIIAFAWLSGVGVIAGSSDGATSQM